MFKKKTNFEKLPNHIAFIMDGNRRWAKERGLDKTLGHRQGAIALKNIIQALSEIKGIKYASFFAFSTENWNREQKEIDYIFDLAYNLIKENEKSFQGNNIKVVAMGETSKFPDKLRKKLEDVVEMTKNNTGLVVNLALNYGGRADIVRAAKLAMKNGQVLTEENLAKNLYCDVDVDFVIRTSGEMRISNFMLYQMAYSELYFTKTYWPDFDKHQLFKALKEFSKRNRRFGGN